MTDNQTPSIEPTSLIGQCTEKFAAGPVGVWFTELDYRMGWGFSGLVTGLIQVVEFRADGTGSLTTNCGGESTDEFHWKSLGPMRISIIGESPEDPEEIQYEFFSPLGSTAVLMRNIGDQLGEDGFWNGVGPVALSESELGHPTMGTLAETRAIYRAIAESDKNRRQSDIREKRRTRIWLGVAAVGCLILAAALFTWIISEKYLWIAFIPLVIGGALVWELWERWMK